MPWVRLDDKLHSHPKILRVGNEGAGLYARALSYCGDLLTDGFVPAEWVKGVATAKLARTLMAAGLWQEVDGGFQIPDFLDLNPSREQVESKRKADRVRKDSSRNPRGVAADSNGPRPDPYPNPETTAKGSRPTGLDDDRWRELERILGCVTDADSSTPSVFAVYARQLPHGAVAKVRESAESHKRRVGAGWVVNALKDEIRLREAA